MITCSLTERHIARNYILYPCMPTYIDAHKHIYSCKHKYIIIHVCLHIYFDMYTYIQKHACLPTNIHTYGFLPPYICTCIHTYMVHVHILASIDLCMSMYLHIYIPTYSCMSTCINMDINTYIHQACNLNKGPNGSLKQKIIFSSFDFVTENHLNLCSNYMMQNRMRNLLQITPSMFAYIHT